MLSRSFSHSFQLKRLAITTTGRINNPNIPYLAQGGIRSIVNLRNGLSTAADAPPKSTYEEGAAADHFGRLQNHIWSKEEVSTRLNNLYRHTPLTITDHVMNKLMYSLYHTFNFITGYKHKDPSVKSIEWRLIVLESVAGVPGFIGAGFRHFRSLRMLQRDNGWITTLLEEAENERMHLLVCMKMFKASFATRAMVISLQVVLTPFLMTLYAFHPKSVHRFVGYLEETACHTYASIVSHLDTPGTQLNIGWKDLASPEIAINYWKLPQDAKFRETLLCMFADECNHRDVNHTFASMDQKDANPFIGQHREQALKALRMEMLKERCW